MSVFSGLPARLACLSLMLGATGFAADPTWWTQSSPPVINPYPTTLPDNLAVANIGQAKWMAMQALAALKKADPALAAAVTADLVGTGKPIATFDAPTTQAAKDAQMAPLLVGQLKAIAAPFYTHIQNANSPFGAIWLTNERTANHTNTGDGYFPWTTTNVSDDSNGAVAVIGQLKAVFALHFTEDTDYDGIPDFYEWVHFGSLSWGNNPTQDTDGDGMSDVWEILHGRNPNVADEDGNGIPDGSDDDDGDGATNAEEIAAGTDPSDANDFPPELVTAFITAGGGGSSSGYDTDGYDWLQLYSGQTTSTSAFTPGKVVEQLSSCRANMPTSGQDVLDAEPNYSHQWRMVDAGAIKGESAVNLDPTGGAVGMNSYRVLVHAPQKTTPQTFTFVKVSTYTLGSGPDPEFHDSTSTSVTLTIPANESFSDYQDLEADLLTSVAGYHTVNVSLVLPDMAADTDRDGYAQWAADRDAKDVWTNARGAIYAVNFDADGASAADINNKNIEKIPDAISFDDNGNGIGENWTIENAEDAKDIAPLQIMPMELPEDYRVYLAVDDKEGLRAMHLYSKIGADENAIWGSYGDPAVAPWKADLPSSADANATEIDITKWVNTASKDGYVSLPAGEVTRTFGVEGLVLRGMKVPGGRLSLTASDPNYGKFSGEILFSLKVVDGSGAVVADNLSPTRIRVAPWLMMGTRQPSEQIWATDYSPLNSKFLNETPAGSGKPNYAGLSVAGEVSLTGATDNDSIWVQDQIEIGYTQRPGGRPTTMLFRLPYDRPDNPPQPIWPLKQLLGPNVGVFQLGKNVGNAASGDYGGNLDVSPTNNARPLGTVVMGNTSSPNLQAFLKAQVFQTTAGSFLPDCSWLNVGHVDEFATFLPNNTLAVASPEMGIAMLQDSSNIPYRLPDTNARPSSLFFAPTVQNAPPVIGKIAAETTSDHPTVIHTDLALAHPELYHWMRFYSGRAKGYVAQVTVNSSGVATIVNDTVPLGASVPSLWNSGKTMSSYKSAIDAGIRASGWGIDPDTGMTAAPNLNDRFVLVPQTLRWYSASNDGFPAAITVEEILGDAEFVNINETKIQSVIDTEQAKILGLAGGSPAMKVVYVPALFFGQPCTMNVNGISTRSSVAFNPGAANMQPFNGCTLVPRQYSPKNLQGDDLYEDFISNHLSKVFYPDDWSAYHVRLGEVHCGTYVRRELPSEEWWKKIN